MSNLRLWALLGGIFVASVVGSAFVTDALHDDAGLDVVVVQSVEMPVDEIEVLTPVYTTPTGSTDPNGDLAVSAAPELLAEDFVPEPSGMRVLMPPEELWESPTEQEVVDDFFELVARIQPDVVDEDGSTEDDPVALGEAAEPFIEAPRADDFRDFRDFLDLSDGNRTRFFDPCALLADGCVFGFPAIVALGNAAIPLRIDFQIFEGRPENIEALCPSFAAQPNRFHVLVRTTVPTAIHLEYLKQGGSGEVIEANLELPAIDEVGRQNWQRSVDEGTFDVDNGSTWVQRCMELVVENDSSYVFESVEATAADGRVVALEWIPTLGTGDGARSGNRPPTKVTPTSDNNIQVEVWSRSPEDGYQTVAIAVPQGGSGERPCTDYEASFVGLTRDFVVDDSHAIARVDRLSDPSDWKWRHTISLPLLEGTHYAVCVWEVSRGDSTFDAVQIENRDQIDVITPNRHRVAVSVDNIRLDQATKAQFVVADAGQSCDIYGPRLPLSGGGLAVGGTLVSSGTTVVNDQFCATDGSAPRRAIFTRVSVGDELFDRDHQIVALPFDVNSGCEIGGDDPRCSNSFSQYFDHDFTALCRGTCDSLRVLFRLDYLPSNGAGTERWQVGDAATFAATSVQDPNLPQVDLDSLRFFTTASFFGASMEFTLNHPADYDITLISGEAGCERQVTGSGAGLVELMVEDLCPDAFYRITSIRLTDADGNKNEQYPIGGRIRDSIYAKGFAAYFDAFIWLDSVLDESVATERCKSLAQVDSSITDRCWEHLRVYNRDGNTNADTKPNINGSRIEIAGVLSEGSTHQVCAYYPFASDAAQTSAPRTHLRDPNTRNGPVHGNLVEVSGTLVVGVDPHCGGGGADKQSVFTEIEFGFAIPPWPLAQPVHLAIESDGLLWDVEIIRTDRGTAPGDG